MALKVLALETSRDRVRAALAERSWESFRLLGIFDAARADGEPSLASALTRLVAQSGKPDVVISALPSEMVAHRVLTLPFKDPRKLRQVVPFALEEHLPFPIDEAISAFIRLGDDGDGSAVLAAVVRNSDLRSHLDLLREADLDPKCVTLGPLALARFLARASADGRRNGAHSHLVLNIDEARTSLILLDSDGTPRAMRTVLAGLDPAGSTPLGDRAAATIVAAARQTLLAHGPDLAPPDLLVAGPASAVPGVRSEIADGLAIAVRDTSEISDPGLLESFQGPWLRFGACVAMLLGESPTDPIELLNFRQGEFAFRGKTFDSAPLHTSALLAVALAVLAAFHLVLGTTTSLRRLNVLDNQVETLTAPALGPISAAEAPAALRSGIATIRKQLKLMGGGSEVNSPLEVLLAVSRALPERLPVEFSDVLIDSTGLKFDGEADSFGTVDQVKKTLSGTGLVTDIEINDAKVSSETNKVNFHLSATLAENPPSVARAEGSIAAPATKSPPPKAAASAPVPPAAVPNLLRGAIAPNPPSSAAPENQAPDEDSDNSAAGDDDQ